MPLVSKHSVDIGGFSTSLNVDRHGTRPGQCFASCRYRRRLCSLDPGQLAHSLSRDFARMNSMFARSFPHAHRQRELGGSAWSSKKVHIPVHDWFRIE